MKDKISYIKYRILESKLFKDSFWAVIGNGLGNGLLLLSGIIIARILGKDLYGEYGMVKLTVFYIAMFACFGLGTTSTKYIACLVESNKSHIRLIMRDAMKITLCFSLFLAILILIFASPIAYFLEAPQLSKSFRFMAVIIVLKALSTTQCGILAGLKEFKRLGINSILSGLYMIIICFPLTYYWGLVGALISLATSQLFNYLINAYYINKLKFGIESGEHNYTKELIRFSLPVALQEGSVNVSNWCALLLLSKLSSSGEVGLFTASVQWNAVVGLLPSLLMNVIISYISGLSKDKKEHDRVFKHMIYANSISTIIPVGIFIVMAGYISSFYGDSFQDMTKVMRILLLVPVFECCTTVFKAEYLSNNKNWLFLGFRITRDILFLFISYWLLSKNNGTSGAYYHSISMLSASIIFLLMQLMGYYQIKGKTKNS